MSDQASKSPRALMSQVSESTDGRAKRAVMSWAPILGGGVLALYGVSRRTFGGLVLASAGTALIYRGAMPRPVTVRTGGAVTINKPLEEVYRVWRDFKNLPNFMENLVSVDVKSETRSHWTAKTVGGAKVSWDATIVEDEPNRRIAWRSDENAEIATNGVIEFECAPGNRGTEVYLTLEYTLPVGMFGSAVAAALGSEPSQQARSDLNRFKQFMEAGEVPTTEGQPAGRRGRAPEPESLARWINDVLEGASILRTGGRSTRSRAGTRV